MTTLYLIRHAEAEGNLYRIAQGQYDSILTDRGARQVEALARRFADIPVDAVYSSDLYRTCATAQAICGPKGLPLHRRRDLREICVGVWEQRTWGDIARTWPEQMENFSHRLHLWHMEGAETPAQVRDRVLAAVREIAAENDGKTVAVFSHGCALRLLLAAVQGYSLEELGKTPHGDNTAVSLLEAEGGELRVVYRDDNRHLQDPLYTAGETVRKRANALEPGLYFEPLDLPGQADFFARCAEEAWADAGEARPFDRARLLADAPARRTLVGYLAGEPVGAVQFGPAGDRSGRIALACVRGPFRGRGFGVQLLGQAVTYYRPLGVRSLRAVLPEGAPSRGFFADHGFRPAGRTADGRTVLEKDIGYRPEILGE